MFDIGFWELVIMTLVALVIIGPERLPAFANDAGKLVKKIRSFIQNAKREIETELKLDQFDDLNDSIDHVEGLMKQAPDRILQDQMDKKNQNSIDDSSN